MRILLTGATGFAGGHLAEALLSQPGVELLGVSQRGRWPAEWKHLEGRLSLRACDLTGREQTQRVLQDWQPAQIYHLAGYAHVGRSFRETDAAWAGNLGATRNLLDAVSSWGGKPRLLLVSSGLIYGEAEAVGQACDERCLLRPESPYAASKAAADRLTTSGRVSPLNSRSPISQGKSSASSGAGNRPFWKAATCARAAT
jgi:GDP-4-dehydro-6-deoxy-D-mannose reductase